MSRRCKVVNRSRAFSCRIITNILVILIAKSTRSARKIANSLTNSTIYTKQWSGCNKRPCHDSRRILIVSRASSGSVGLGNPTYLRPLCKPSCPSVATSNRMRQKICPTPVTGQCPFIVLTRWNVPIPRPQSNWIFLIRNEGNGRELLCGRHWHREPGARAQLSGRARGQPARRRVVDLWPSRPAALTDCRWWQRDAGALRVSAGTPTRAGARQAHGGRGHRGGRRCSRRHRAVLAVEEAHAERGVSACGRRRLGHSSPLGHHARRRCAGGQRLSVAAGRLARAP